MDGGLLLRELLQHVDQHVANQVLARRDPDFLLPGLDLERPTQLSGALQKREGVGHEAPSRIREHGRTARAAGLAIELDAELRFEREEPVP